MKTRRTWLVKHFSGYDFATGVEGAKTHKNAALDKENNRDVLTRLSTFSEVRFCYAPAQTGECYCLLSNILKNR